MKIIISYSGGKDSQACLIWAVKKFGANNCEAVFCDTGWENPVTYSHIETTCEQLGVALVTVKSKKYDGFVDMAHKKGMFPATKTRFCTEELKIKPFIDYILSQYDHLLIMQGIRSQESANRSKMERQCTYFKYYFEPFKNGRTHYYKKKEVVEWSRKYNADIERPVFDWSGQEVIDYIVANGQKPNPLYSKGFSRVGCFPCVMSRHMDIRMIAKNYPEAIEKIIDAEKFVGRTFFHPGYIPKKFNKDGKLPVDVVIKYLKDKNATADIFDEPGATCMSIYNLCE